MNKFLYSPKLLYILAALLVIVFFLPDLIGPIPAIILGGLVIAFALYVYNLWSGTDENNQPPDGEEDR